MSKHKIVDPYDASKEMNFTGNAEASRNCIEYLRGVIDAEHKLCVAYIDMNSKLYAESTELQKALEELANAEYRYRIDHDVRGDGSTEAGRSWDNMRHKGDLARIALTKYSKDGE
jgi:hypothetical protein